ncbi:hypothetical protein GLOTRDRAFT_93869 [Gloeophyllum trabeum ATCC 11539]|uniref:Uncharacterized protein n=1 Tax=Gloeophyllum trabeum (strain ATCC 11539 / FP-39264 / Madison 617) TaxID=670483 RepID=S7RLZ8_GLOTA|nr:uncharacterized protein GLOTRDRAFT_93869 [Gloeophyllum trabeum ATCC 11539]EPQ55420.1 hypothetical protein GLOTRDRAFT_93869 [Gloeophyllum trabeum ATCC 11539]
MYTPQGAGQSEFAKGRCGSKYEVPSSQRGYVGTVAGIGIRDWGARAIEFTMQRVMPGDLAAGPTLANWRGGPWTLSEGGLLIGRGSRSGSVKAECASAGAQASGPSSDRRCQRLRDALPDDGRRCDKGAVVAQTISATISIRPPINQPLRAR